MEVTHVPDEHDRSGSGRLGGGEAGNSVRPRAPREQIENRDRPASTNGWESEAEPRSIQRKSESRQRSRPSVNDLADELIEARLKTGAMTFREPNIADAIAHIAEKSKAVLIVTGTRGHSEIPGLFVGSVTQRLLDLGKQPVLAVPGFAEFTRGEAPFKTIVLARRSGGSKRAIQLPRAGPSRGAKIVIAHIEERTIGKGGGPIHRHEEEIRAEIDKLAEELSKQGPQRKARAADATVGGLAHVLASTADESGAGRIVTGSRGHQGERPAPGRRHPPPAATSRVSPCWRSPRSAERGAPGNRPSGSAPARGVR